MLVKICSERVVAETIDHLESSNPLALTPFTLIQYFVSPSNATVKGNSLAKTLTVL